MQDAPLSLRSQAAQRLPRERPVQGNVKKCREITFINAKSLVMISRGRKGLKVKKSKGWKYLLDTFYTKKNFQRP